MKSQRDKNLKWSNQHCGSCQMFVPDLQIVTFCQFSNLWQNCVIFCQNSIASSWQLYVGVGLRATWVERGQIWPKLGSSFIQMHSWSKLFEVAGEIFSGWWDIFDSSDIDFLITLLKRQFDYREDVDCEKIDSQQIGNNESLEEANKRKYFEIPGMWLE